MLSLLSEMKINARDHYMLHPDDITVMGTIP